MKKFQNLGTALSREQSKKVTGGDECVDCGGGGGNVVCISCGGGETLCAGSRNWTCVATGYNSIMCGNMNTMEIKHYSCWD